MTIINTLKDKANNKIMCFNERLNKYFYIPFMDDNEIIDYIKTKYKEIYKHTYILLRVYEE